MKPAEKRSLANFRKKVEEIKSLPVAHLDESSVDKELRIARLLKDYNAFVGYYFPRLAKVSCGDFQVKNAEYIVRNDRLCHVVAWARAHAKTTHHALFLPLFLKFQKKKTIHFMLLVAKSKELATEQLNELQAELQYNKRIAWDFGRQEVSGDWSEGAFSTTDDTRFMAMGRGQTARGLKYRGQRPDYIVLDDLDDMEIVLNSHRMRKLYSWVLSDIYPATQMGRGRLLAVGNIIHKNSLISQLKSNPSFTVSIINALDAQGKPSWSENYTIEEIERMVKTIGINRAQAELFNNPVIEGGIFKHADIVFDRPPPLSRCHDIVVYCDPSFKANKTSDYKAVVVITRFESKFYVLDAFVRRCEVSEMLNFFYQFYEQTQHLPIATRFYGEANFFQGDFLLAAFDRENKKRGYILPFHKDMRKKPDKFQRIIGMAPLFENRQIVFNEKKREDADMQTLIAQILGMEQGARGADDAPDALEGALHKLNRIVTEAHPPVIKSAKKKIRYI